MPLGFGLKQFIPSAVSVPDGLPGFLTEWRSDFMLTVPAPSVNPLTPLDWTARLPTPVNSVSGYFMRNTHGGGALFGHGPNFVLVSPWQNGQNAFGPGLQAEWDAWSGTNSGSGSFGVGSPPPPASFTSQYPLASIPEALTFYMVMQFETTTPLYTAGIYSVSGGPTSIQSQLNLTSSGVLSLEDYDPSNNAHYYIDTYNAVGSMTSPGILCFQHARNPFQHNIEWNRTALTSTGTTNTGSVPAYYINSYLSFLQSVTPSPPTGQNTLRATVGHILVYASYHGSGTKTAVYNYLHSFWNL